MQTAVLGVCRYPVKDVVRARLLRACGNNCSSGLAGGPEEGRNFHAVARVLRSVGKRVRVLDVQSMSDFWDGLWLGGWSGLCTWFASWHIGVVSGGPARVCGEL